MDALCRIDEDWTSRYPTTRSVSDQVKRCTRRNRSFAPERVTDRHSQEPMQCVDPQQISLLPTVGLNRGVDQQRSESPPHILRYQIHLHRPMSRAPCRQTDTSLGLQRRGILRLGRGKRVSPHLGHLPNTFVGSLHRIQLGLHLIHAVEDSGQVLGETGTRDDECAGVLVRRRSSSVDSLFEQDLAFFFKRGRRI